MRNGVFHVLFVLATATMLSSCSTKTVVVSGCKPAPPPDDCTPPDCYGGGIECQWDITSKSPFQPLIDPQSNPEKILASDRFVGAIVVSKGEAVGSPDFDFKGSVLPTDDLLSVPQKALLRSDLITRGVFDPGTQDITYFRTTNPIPFDDGTGHMTVRVGKFSGTYTTAGTVESDLNDGAPLDHLQIFTEHVDMPVADAAGPYTAECAGGHTSIHLHGTASRATRGGALSYLWSTSCPGGTFDDATSATPTLTIDTSCGCNQSCSVQLIVTEGVLSSASVAPIKIVDTTPPEIAIGKIPVPCPTNGPPPSLQIECTGDNGTTLANPLIAEFLGSAKATDVCCKSGVTLSNNAPGFFPLGSTSVTFTATDCNGNSSSCAAIVTVADQTPPTISVSLDRTALWPSNHKLVTINATVTVADVCDPNPFFQLVSIVSNEPDNGLGDGDTPNDIQGADYGTADSQFQLRSERAGGGSGRIYTITYRAFDHSGNHADAVVTVRVDHDRSSAALAANGWDEDGTGFAPNAQTFALVVPSIPGVIGEDQGLLDDRLPGTSNPGATHLLMDARAIDVAQAYVGNTAGAIAPVAVARGDVDHDGLTDLVCFYDVGAVQTLQAASTLLDGPIGLHFHTWLGDYLVPDIFALGPPIPLPNLPVTQVGSTGHGTGRVASRPSTPAGEASPAANAPGPAPGAVPTVTELAGVYPNPNQGDATIVFTLARPEAVDLAVYDVRGARVRTIESGAREAGRYLINWNGRDEAGKHVGGGIYFVRLSAGRYVKTHKTIVIP